MTTNNTNDFTKRTASQIKAILKSNAIAFDYVENQGDNRQFQIGIESNIKNLMKLKQAGFIRIDTTPNTITVKTF